MSEIDYKSLLATTASVCTILQFLSGTLTCQKFVETRSTGDASAFPFLSGVLSTALWLCYGFLIQDRSIILVNTIGVSLFFAYVVVFFLYSIKKTLIARQFLGCLLALFFILFYIHRADTDQDARFFLGRMCCLVTILFFAAPFTTFVHVVKSKNTDSLPYHLIVMSFVVSLQWLIYGLMLEDQFIQIPNFLGCVLSGIQLSLFVIYPSRPKTVYFASSVI